MVTTRARCRQVDAQRVRFDDLPAAVRHDILDLVPFDERVHTVRLVCKAWALAPLRRLVAHNEAQCTNALKCVERSGKRTSKRAKPLLRFDQMVSIEIASDSPSMPKLLQRALAAPSCSRLQSVTLGRLIDMPWKRDDAQRFTDAVVAGAPHLKHLTLGSTRYGKLWQSGTIRLSGLSSLESIEANCTPHPNRCVLQLGHLPALRSVRCNSVSVLDVSAASVPGDATLSLDTAWPALPDWFFPAPFLTEFVEPAAVKAEAARVAYFGGTSDTVRLLQGEYAQPLNLVSRMVVALSVMSMLIRTAGPTVCLTGSRFRGTLADIL